MQLAPVSTHYVLHARANGQIRTRLGGAKHGEARFGIPWEMLTASLGSQSPGSINWPAPLAARAGRRNLAEHATGILISKKQ